MASSRRKLAIAGLVAAGAIGLLALVPEPPKLVHQIPQMADGPGPVQDGASGAQRHAIVARFNSNARAINARLREAHDRGQAVCDRLERIQGDAGRGFPRPAPNYVEMMRERLE